MPLEELIRIALEARRHAYAPYSSLAVGAALLTGAGEVFPGANVENASLGLTICAERVALGAAVTAGVRAFQRLLLVADVSPPITPCGACRQVLMELAPALVVVTVNLKGEQAEYYLPELLPNHFQWRG